MRRVVRRRKRPDEQELELDPIAFYEPPPEPEPEPEPEPLPELPARRYPGEDGIPVSANQQVMALKRRSVR